MSNLTPTILIRRAVLVDAEAIARIFDTPRAVAGTLQMPYPSIDAWRKRIEPKDDTTALVACVNGEVVGNIGLNTFPNNPRRRHCGRIGMAVRDDWQGKGIGTALMQAVIDLADRWHNLTRLELDVYTDNEAAIKLYKKFGFVIEGTLTRMAFRDGEFVDGYFMARLR